ncbi:hypothetical protein [Novosphingobium malaysiense]|uniref:Uncharacterized protein n=1 Tax=Novosphingobium malaysiense TaxID=1348853 RepID=A0A0B1ZK51_9SPHN|nr:hypothetical protein [Novosphingobium malaysiense]KHK89546.1 hypothetical protein LK12_20850 [Novosphingobium malaysiense]
MSVVKREFAAFLATQRDSFLLWRLAPIVPLIAILPEFAQHVVEVRIGMFENGDAFRALAVDPQRMASAAIKVAGLIICVVMAALVWANRERGTRLWSFAAIGWRQVLVGFAIQIVASLPGMLTAGISPQAATLVAAVLTVASLPGLVLMIGGLVGDRQTGLAQVYSRGWGQALRIAVHFGPGWVLLQAVHNWNHMAALGRPDSLVWSLMAWDALVVGLMATLAGTAMHHGYRLGGPAAETP